MSRIACRLNGTTGARCTYICTALILIVMSLLDVNAPLNWGIYEYAFRFVVFILMLNILSPKVKYVGEIILLI